MQETRARRLASDDLDSPVLGDVNAPLVVRYFADYKCPHCRTIETSGTLDALRERFVDTGKAKLAFVDFPVLGRDSYLAAAASRFVWRTAPDVFWTWHRAMFEKQREWSGVEGIVQVARAFPGIDGDAMGEAIRGGDFPEEVAREVEAAHAAGVHATPSVVVGGQVVVANDPVAVQDALLDALGENLGG